MRNHSTPGRDESTDPGVTVELGLNPCSVTRPPSNLHQLSLNSVQQMFIESITYSVVSPKVIKMKRSDPCFQGDQNLAMVTGTCTIKSQHRVRSTLKHREQWWILPGKLLRHGNSSAGHGEHVPSTDDGMLSEGKYSSNRKTIALEEEETLG